MFNACWPVTQRTTFSPVKTQRPAFNRRENHRFGQSHACAFTHTHAISSPEIMPHATQKHLPIAMCCCRVHNPRKQRINRHCLYSVSFTCECIQCQCGLCGCCRSCRTNMCNDVRCLCPEPATTISIFLILFYLSHTPHLFCGGVRACAHLTCVCI